MFEHLRRLVHRYDTLKAENETLKRKSVYLYNCGYHAGHHDTVEGGYTDVLPVDMNSYHKDIVLELLSEMNSEADQ
jgi:hypothetical protein